MKKSLQDRLANYLIARPFTKVAKGELEDRAKEKMGVTGETVGRRLRVLHEATNALEGGQKSQEHAKAVKLAKGGKFLVEYRGKNHCWYWYQPPSEVVERRTVIVDGVAKEVYQSINS